MPLAIASAWASASLVAFSSPVLTLKTMRFNARAELSGLLFICVNL